jgi:hypothetical protein
MLCSGIPSLVRKAADAARGCYGTPRHRCHVMEEGTPVEYMPGRGWVLPAMLKHHHGHQDQCSCWHALCEMTNLRRPVLVQAAPPLCFFYQSRLEESSTRLRIRKRTVLTCYSLPYVRAAPRRLQAYRHLPALHCQLRPPQLHHGTFGGQYVLPDHP